MYVCPKCKTDVKDVRKLICYLRNVHALSDGQDKSIQLFAVRTFANEHTTTSTQHLHAFRLQRTRDFLFNKYV